MLGGLVHWHPIDPLSSQSVWSGWVVVKMMFHACSMTPDVQVSIRGRQLGAYLRCPA